VAAGSGPQLLIITGGPWSGWRALLGMGPVSIPPVAAFVAAAVYLTDVRPKTRSFQEQERPSSAPTAPVKERGKRKL
jgi:hypothetical protein